MVFQRGGIRLRRIIAVILACLCCISLTGCDYVQTDIDSMISPPKMTEQQADIYKAMKKSSLVEDDVVLKYPQNGTNRSAIVMQDIDTEISEEAMVFYKNVSKTTSSDMGLKICLLDQIDGNWKAKWTVPLSGTSIDQVSFLKEPDTNQKFVIVGTSDEKKTQKQYQVFSYTQQGFYEVYTNSYQVLEVYDLNQDGRDEIITVVQSGDLQDSKATINEKTQIETMAVVTEYLGGQFHQTYQTPMNQIVADYIKITKNEDSFGRPALFLDELIGSSTYATEILTFSDGQLVNLTYGSDIFSQTVRTQVPSCYDINRDGKIEIPNTSFMPGYNEESENPVYLTKWYQLENGVFQLVSNTYINYAQGFGIILPQTWEQTVSANSVVEKDEIDFYIYQDNTEQQEKIFTLKMDTSANIRSTGMPTGYFEIMTMGQIVFLAKLYQTSDPQYNLTEQQLKENFIDLHLMGE